VPASSRTPFRYSLMALGVAARRQAGAEWRGSPLHRALLARPRPEGLAANPHDLRPADPENGRRILAGALVLGGETLAFGQRGDPWNRASPSRRFAVALHRFGWLRDLAALGEPGAAEGLRLTLEWRRLFGSWNAFSWSPEVLERRVFNLACAARAICAKASEAEVAQISGDLARQARFLLGVGDDPLRASERAAAAAVAAAALGGRASEALLAKALRRLAHALPDSLSHDGGHASRSPQAALELFYDLTTLDDALVQRGVTAPEEMMRAIDRLASAVRFFTLADGRLAAFQGGEELSGPYVAAARAQDEDGERAIPSHRNGYHRLEARSLQVMADAAGPAPGAWSAAACAQPLAIEVLAGGRRLIVGGGWTPECHGPQALRLVDASSTLSVGDAPCGQPLSGFAARVLGPRLYGAHDEVEARRHEAPGALWLELAHQGWGPAFGFRHERRLYIDIEADELRGEDRLSPLQVRGPRNADGRRFVPIAVRFHLHPEVSALIAADKTSVLLKAHGEEIGWWLRSDALDVMLEPATHYQNGQPRRSQQIVLRGQARLDAGARIRWKLSAAQSRVDAEDPPA
jgi:uncharacterized heparinase superfamily protein